MVVCMSGFLDSLVGELKNICNLGMFWEDFVWEHKSLFGTKIPKSIFQRGPKPCAPEVA